MPAFVKLLGDVEAEVRVAAAGKVASFCKLLNQEQVQPRSTTLSRKEEHGTVRLYDLTQWNSCGGGSCPPPGIGSISSQSNAKTHANDRTRTSPHMFVESYSLGK